mgnify:FL=1
MGLKIKLQMKKNTTLFLIIFCVTSCIMVPKGVRENFNYCFDGKKTGLDSLININGFYYLGEDYEYLTNGEFIFYDNGFVRSGHGKSWSEQNFDNSIQYGSYGKYSLSNDTIKMQIISSPEGMGVTEYKIWFKIINYNSIEVIYQGKLNDITKSDLKKFKDDVKSDIFYKKKGSIYKISPTKRKSDINKTYIIHKKWFWCNELDYKTYKKNNL